MSPGPRAILALFMDICEAVDYAHGNDVIHRDLKPANVLIDGNGNPHIMDFGLAKATDSDEKEDTVSADVSLPGQVMGTLRYLSPEQATGALEEVDVRTDVYALGVMLYEALTGSLPFDTSGRPSDVIRRILEEPPGKPTSASHQVDGELETILLKALEKEQARRYASAREMGEDIRRYLTGEPILAKRASTLYLLRKRIRRNRSKIAVAVSALALGCAGVWGGFWWSQRTLDRQLAETLARERREVLLMQRGLEIGDEQLAREADFAFAQYRHLEEAPLVTARARWEADNVEEAISLLKGQLGKQPTKWPCRELLAELYRHLDEKGALESAARHQRAVEQQDVPDNAETWYLRSFTTLDPEFALDRAYEAVDLDPEYPLAWERILYLCLDLEDFQGALAAAGRLMGLAGNPVKWIRERTRIEALLASSRAEEQTQVGKPAARPSTQPTSAPAMLRPGPPVR